MSKVLIVANGTATGDHIVARVREIMQADPSTRFELVLPRIPGSPEGSDTEQLRRRSADRCDRAVEQLSSIGADVGGQLGPSQPMVAIARAIAAFEPTMVIISTLPLGVSRWLEIDLINRVRHHFEIPVEHLPAAASSENGDRAPRAGSSDRRVPRVLVVEDNPQDAELTLLALERTAVEIDVQVARSGASALELLRTQGELGFDLVLLDLKMPIVDGFGFLAQAAEIVGLEELAVVVLTTSVDDADRARANELGVLRFLQKDPDFVRFSDTLTHLLNELLA